MISNYGEKRKWRFNKMAAVIIMAAVLLPCSAQLLDELDALEAECIGEDKFQCLEGSCIPQDAYCDGKIDCPEGSDENFCPHHLPDPEFCNKTHHFLCNDKLKCIPLSWICNNDTDCNDGSDEVNCTDATNHSTNKTCKGFSCDEGKTCISTLWMCDGFYDCQDKTDEIIEENCHHKYRNHIMQDPLYCLSELSTGEQHHYCSDSSYCLPGDMMCDGIPDCRDGSDEGPFCANWTTMCTAENNPCVENITRCFPDRNGPTCMCESFANEKKFNYEKKICEDVDECAQLKPHCSHYCENAEGRYICSCDEGYTTDPFSYLCYATGE
ncbi:low-density lipoprotein receptor 1-like isoform X2 [Ostrinia furnacalis]|uniref:low-density lipoprotein receptor 1-like isoform X2 n=1 Tax=Ostrinia furnacalis TaxID=93504 RepID=UPI00103EE951|nr:low-density lipoprotein receptor 1-like isoform X2 [Ostrinia furnacalis]